MKDYGIESSKKGEFILNYRIKDDYEIIVNYANGDSITIPNTIKNLEILEKTMKQQVIDSGNYLKSCKEKKIVQSVLTIFGSVVMLLPIGAITFFTTEFNYILSLISGFGFIISSTSLCDLISNKEVINDIEKNMKFLEIESHLNEKVNENYNMLYKTHNVTKKVVANNKDNDVIFTINNIDKIPFSDLERIEDNIIREERFNFEYPNVEDEIVKKKTK